MDGYRCLRQYRYCFASHHCWLIIHRQLLSALPAASTITVLQLHPLLHQLHRMLVVQPLLHLLMQQPLELVLIIILLQEHWRLPMLAAIPLLLRKSSLLLIIHRQHYLHCRQHQRSLVLQLHPLLLQLHRMLVVQPLVTFTDATAPGTCANNYTVTRTLSATDACGNTATASQVITVDW